jgi:hypothetical protein
VLEIAEAWFNRERPIAGLRERLQAIPCVSEVVTLGRR